MSRYRNLVFTLNNYTQSEVNAIKTLDGDNDISYLIFGYEVGESGTPHLQGYIELSKQKSLRQLKKLLSP